MHCTVLSVDYCECSSYRALTLTTVDNGDDDGVVGDVVVALLKNARFSAKEWIEDITW